MYTVIGTSTYIGFYAAAFLILGEKSLLSESFIVKRVCTTYNTNNKILLFHHEKFISYKDDLIFYDDVRFVIIFASQIL